MSMEKVRIDYESQILHRATYYNVWLPPQPAGKPLLIFLHGWGALPEEPFLVQAAECLAQVGLLSPAILFPWGFGAQECSEWKDHWDGSLCLETSLVQETIPDAERRFGLDGRARSRMICGASMGGFGAINLALHHQELFCSCVALSPVDVKNDMKLSEPEELFSQAHVELFPSLAGMSMRDSEERVWGPLPESTEHRIHNSPWHYVEKDPSLSFALSFDCGDGGFPEELMIPSILDFHAKLLSLRLPHAFEQYHGGHCESATLEGYCAKLAFMYSAWNRAVRREDEARGDTA